jgi:hypothetical protein
MPDCAARFGCANADTQPRDLLRAEMLDHRLQPLMAAGSAAGAQPEFAQRKRHVIEDDERFRRGNLVKTGDLADGASAQIHIGERFAKIRFAIARQLRLPGLFRAPGRTRSSAQTIEHHKADIMTGLMVVAPRIAETNQQAVRHGRVRAVNPKNVLISSLEPSPARPRAPPSSP